MSENNPFNIVDYLEEARSRVTEQFKLDVDGSGSVVFDKYLQLLLRGKIELQEVFRELMQERSIDTATGKQLDIVGDIVGQPREIIDSSLLTFFAFQGYPDAQSYGDLNNPAFGGPYYDVNNALAGNTLLTDDQYRLFIKAKIIKNNTNVTPNQFIQFMQFVFGEGLFLVVAEGDAEFTMMVGRVLTSFEKVLLSYISYSSGYGSRFIPKPVGVKVNYGQFLPDNYFGFQGAPGAKGYGTLGASAQYESLKMDFVSQVYQLDNSFGGTGGGRYGGLI